MPRRCCVTGCQSNYDSTLKVEKAESTFLIPKDVERRKQWLTAIPRANWIPGPTAAVCAKHFHESDIIKSNICRLADGTCHEELLRYPKLKEDAIPSIFPNLLHYHSSKEKTKCLHPNKRRKKIVEREKELVNDFLASDLVNDFDDVKDNIDHKIELGLWDIKITDNILCFYIINFDGAPSIKTSIIISRDLIMTIYLKVKELSFQDLKWILPYDMKLSRWSQLQNLLNRYASDENVSKCTIVHIQEGLKCLKKAKERAKEEEFLYEKELHNIIDQLKEIISLENSRVDVIEDATKINCTSPKRRNVEENSLSGPSNEVSKTDDGICTKRVKYEISTENECPPEEEENLEDELAQIKAEIKKLMHEVEDCSVFEVKGSTEGQVHTKSSATGTCKTSSTPPRKRFLKRKKDKTISGGSPLSSVYAEGVTVNGKSETQDMTRKSSFSSKRSECFQLEVGIQTDDLKELEDIPVLKAEIKQLRHKLAEKGKRILHLEQRLAAIQQPGQVVLLQKYSGNLSGAKKFVVLGKQTNKAATKKLS